MTKKQVNKERDYLVYTSISQFILKETQDRKSNRAGILRWGSHGEVMKGYYLLGLLHMACSTCSHIDPRIMMALPIMGWADPDQSLIYKMLSNLTLDLIS